MSDFLSYLVGRQQGTSAALRPLVKPRFADEGVAEWRGEEGVQGFEEIHLEREGTPALVTPPSPAARREAPTDAGRNGDIPRDGRGAAMTPTMHGMSGESRPSAARMSPGLADALAMTASRTEAVRTRSEPFIGEVQPAVHSPVEAWAPSQADASSQEQLRLEPVVKTQGREPVRHQAVLAGDEEFVSAPVRPQTVFAGEERIAAEPARRQDETRFTSEPARRQEMPSEEVREVRAPEATWTRREAHDASPSLSVQTPAPRGEAQPAPAQSQSSFLARVDGMVSRRQPAHIEASRMEPPRRVAPLVSREAGEVTVPLEQSSSVELGGTSRGTRFDTEAVPAPREAARASVTGNAVPTDVPRTGAFAVEPERRTSAPMPLDARRQAVKGTEPEQARSVAPRSEPRSSPPVPREAPSAPAAPVVHVTIGRIEVRAVGAANPPQRRAPAPAARPALGLDEYLRRRNEGER